MEIIISPSKKLSQVQDEFRKRFTHLKLEFFDRKPEAVPGKKSEAKLLNNNLLLKEVPGFRSEGSIALNGLRTVAELEKDFQTQFGLFAEIFRKSGKIWLRTSTTDQWTLDEQNHEGRESDSSFHEQTEGEDYHEQE